METAATKLLESATIKTLHANNFSRSSTQATLVLTDLLGRYLSLLSSTCSKYAHHSGRTNLTVYDAIGALEEMGVSIDELQEYGSTEAKELNRYASHSARRMEDLNEFKAQLAIGLKQDRDDATFLQYQPYESPPPSEYDSEEDVEDNEMDADVEDDYRMTIDPQLERKTPPPRPSTPPLPLSPISNPSSPSRKRPRTSHWKSPSHIPDFLPPFPTIDDEPPSSIPPSPRDSQQIETQPSQHLPVEKIPLSVAAQTMTSAAASDYLVQVPYSQSTLSSVPEWHLPSAPSNMSRSQSHKNIPPSLQTEPALFKAYHHILTSRPQPTPPPSNLSRHKVSMAFLAQTQSTPRWDAADTLFSNIAPCPPRVSAIGPSYPVAVTDLMNGKADPKDKDFRFPPTIPRPVSTTERITPLVGQQSNRIPELARHVLPPVVINRTTRLAHPPALHRGSKPLLYGPGIPAPWNSHALVATDNATIPPISLPSTKDHNNKEKEKESGNGGGGGGSGGGGGGEKSSKPLIPDARLFATWDYETKDFKIPLSNSNTPHHHLHSHHHSQRHRKSGIQLQSGSSGVISLPSGSTARSSKSGTRLG